MFRSAQDSGLRLGVGASCVVVAPVTVGYHQTPGSLTTEFQRSLEGIRHLIASERTGIYIQVERNGAGYAVTIFPTVSDH